MQKLIHYLDKSSDPITYITQNESIKHCQTALRLDPNHPDHLKFERNNEWISEEGHINKGIRRQIALILEVEGSIFGYDDRWLGIFGTKRGRSHHLVEQIMHAFDKINGYISPHTQAILKAYLIQKTKRDQSTVSTLEHFFPQSQTKSSDSTNSADSSASSVTRPATQTSALLQPKVPAYKESITNEAFRELVLKDNMSWIEAANNYLRKNYFDSTGHLTHDKTKIFSEQLLRFDPDHPGNSELWRLDPDMPQHKMHVHKTFERERLLCSLVSTAINDDDYDTILTLSPINPQNPKAAIAAGYFSPLLKAVIAGYIEKKNNEIKKDIETQNTSTLTITMCKCVPPQMLKDCLKCRIGQPPAPVGKNPPLDLQKNCDCNPFKILKDCPDCLAKIAKKPDQAPSNSEVNPTLCACNPSKPIKDCATCSSKLGQQPPQ